MPRHRKTVATPRDTLEAKAAEVRQSRHEAAGSESWGAVSAMHRIEFDIIRAIWEREEAEAEAKRRTEEAAAASADPAKLIAALREALFGLPLPLRESLLREVVASGLH